MCLPLERGSLLFNLMGRALTDGMEHLLTGVWRAETVGAPPNIFIVKNDNYHF